MAASAEPVWPFGKRGSYLLVLLLSAARQIEVGGLGLFAFPPGVYVYTGSALGPGGVPARLERHLKAQKTPHWHIDYLEAVAPIIAVSARYGPERLECVWSQCLEALDGCAAPARGFGSSDCEARCRSHLWRLPDDLPLSWLETELTRCPIHPISYKPFSTR